MSEIVFEYHWTPESGQWWAKTIKVAQEEAEVSFHATPHRRLPRHLRARISAASAWLLALGQDQLVQPVVPIVGRILKLKSGYQAVIESETGYQISASIHNEWNCDRKSSYLSACCWALESAYANTVPRKYYIGFMPFDMTSGKNGDEWGSNSPIGQAMKTSQELKKEFRNERKAKVIAALGEGKKANKVKSRDDGDLKRDDAWVAFKSEYSLILIKTISPEWRVHIYHHAFLTYRKAPSPYGAWRPHYSVRLQCLQTGKGGRDHTAYNDSLIGALQRVREWANDPSLKFDEVVANSKVKELIKKDTQYLLGESQTTIFEFPFEAAGWLDTHEYPASFDYLKGYGKKPKLTAKIVARRRVPVSAATRSGYVYQALIYAQPQPGRVEFCGDGWQARWSSNTGTIEEVLRDLKIEYYHLGGRSGELSGGMRAHARGWPLRAFDTQAQYDEWFSSATKPIADAIDAAPGIRKVRKDLILSRLSNEQIKESLFPRVKATPGSYYSGGASWSTSGYWDDGEAARLLRKFGLTFNNATVNIDDFGDEERAIWVVSVDAKFSDQAAMLDFAKRVLDGADRIELYPPGRSNGPQEPGKINGHAQVSARKRQFNLEFPAEETEAVSAEISAISRNIFKNAIKTRLGEGAHLKRRGDLSAVTRRAQEPHVIAEDDVADELGVDQIQRTGLARERVADLSDGEWAEAVRDYKKGRPSDNGDWTETLYKKKFTWTDNTLFGGHKTYRIAARRHRHHWPAFDNLNWYYYGLAQVFIVKDQLWKDITPQIPSRSLASSIRSLRLAIEGSAPRWGSGFTSLIMGELDAMAASPNVKAAMKNAIKTQLGEGKLDTLRAHRREWHETLYRRKFSVSGVQPDFEKLQAYSIVVCRYHTDTTWDQHAGPPWLYYAAIKGTELPEPADLRRTAMVNADDDDMGFLGAAWREFYLSGEARDLEDPDGRDILVTTPHGSITRVIADLQRHLRNLSQPAAAAELGSGFTRLAAVEIDAMIASPNVKAAIKNDAASRLGESESDGFTICLPLEFSLGEDGLSTNDEVMTQHYYYNQSDGSPYKGVAAGGALGGRYARRNTKLAAHATDYLRSIGVEATVTLLGRIETYRFSGLVRTTPAGLIKCMDSMGLKFEQVRLTAPGPNSDPGFASVGPNNYAALFFYTEPVGALPLAVKHLAKETVKRRLD